MQTDSLHLSASCIRCLQQRLVRDGIPSTAALLLVADGQGLDSVLSRACKDGEFRQILGNLDEVYLSILHLGDFVLVLINSDAILVDANRPTASNCCLQIRTLAPEALVVASVWATPHDLVNHVVQYKKCVLPSVQFVLLRLQRQEQVLVLFQAL